MSRCVCVFKRMRPVPTVCERFKAHPLLAQVCVNCSHDKNCHAMTEET